MGLRIACWSRFSFATFKNSSVLKYNVTPAIIPGRSYCEVAEGEEEELPDGEEWVMLRQAKKTTKKRLEAKRKIGKAWRNIAFQAWTHMYKPEDARYMLKSIKEQQKYDDVLLTPKHGERFTRVYRARIIQEHNHARKLKVFPRPGK